MQRDAAKTTLRNLSAKAGHTWQEQVLTHGIVWVTTLHLAEPIEPFDLITDTAGELFDLLTNTLAASNVRAGGRVEFAKTRDTFLQLSQLLFRIATLNLVLLALLAANPNVPFVQRGFPCPRPFCILTCREVRCS